MEKPTRRSIMNEYEEFFMNYGALCFVLSIIYLGGYIVCKVFDYMERKK